MTQEDQSTRRDFMKVSGSSLAAAAATSTFFIKGAHAADEPLKLGLIGCGGRGTGAAAEALRADKNVVLVALGDAFADRAEGALKTLQGWDIKDKVQVKPEHIFSGLDNFKHVVALCDVVVLTTPPTFRPQHLEAAVNAGCHVFCEKPVAVDAPGLRSVLETCRKAKEKNLNIVSGLCYRYEFAKQDTVKRIQDGAVGDILALQCTYNTGGLWHHGREDAWSDVEYQMRNWLYFCWLSGDHINEQHIHSLDKIAWVMGDQAPKKITASGGRAVRTDPKYGDIYDHFNTVYEYENGVKLFSSCRQWESTSTDVSDYVIGTKGIASLQEHKITLHNGDVWQHEKAKDDNMYQNEHNALFNAIRTGETINNGEYMCNSTMMAIAARMSAYTGKALTFDMCMKSKEALAPEALDFGPMEVRPVPRPGETKFV